VRPPERYSSSHPTLLACIHGRPSDYIQLFAVLLSVLDWRSFVRGIVCKRARNGPVSGMCRALGDYIRPVQLGRPLSGNPTFRDLRGSLATTLVDFRFNALKGLPVFLSNWCQRCCDRGYYRRAAFYVRFALIPYSCNSHCGL